MVEVDKERGRIGLRLADDPADRGQVAPRSCRDGHRRRRAPARRRTDRDAAAAEAAAARPATAAAARATERRARAERAHAHRARLGRPGRDRARAVGPLDRARAVGPGRLARRGRTSRPASRTSSSTCCSRARRALNAEQIAQVFDGVRRRGQRRHQQGDDGPATRTSSTSTSSEAFDVMSDMLLRSTYAGHRVGARGRARGDRDVRGRAAGQGARRALAARSSATIRSGRPVIGRGEVIVVADHGRRRAPITTAATCPARSWSRRPATSSTSAIEELARAASPQAERDGAPAGPARRRAGARRRACVPLEGDRAVPHLPRRPGHRAQRRPPVRARDPRRDPRRLDLLAPVPGGPREARPRLRGLLVVEPVHGHRPGRHLRRHARGQRRQGARGDRHRAATGSAASAVERRGARAARASTSRAGSRCRWSRPRAA